MPRMVQSRTYFIRICLVCCHPENDAKTQHGETMSVAAFSSIWITLLNGSSGWTTDLSNLLFCSVLPFTVIEGKRNSLGKVFHIHRGETVGFP